MSFLNRRIYFIIILIIFISLLPVLIIYSLGYNIDFSNRSIENSLNVRLETVPFTSNVLINKKKVSGITPTDLRILGNKNIELEITKDEHISETFYLTGQEGKNTSVKITSLYLLSTKENKLNNFNPTNINYSYFVGDSILYNEIGSEKIKIRDINSLSTFSSQEVKQINQIKIDVEPVFKDIQNNIFFDSGNKLLIWKKSNNWSILDFKSQWINEDDKTAQNLFEFNINSIESINENTVLFTNNNNYLFQLNLKSLFLSIIDTQTIAVSQTIRPNQLWVFDKIGIKRVEKFIFNDKNNLTDFELTNEKVLNTLEYKDFAISCIKSSSCNFKVSNTLAGSMILINNNLFYYQNNKITKINDDILYVTPQRDVVFYVSKLNVVYSYNTITNKSSYLGELLNDEKILDLSFIDEWKRLVIFQENNVSSIWFDKNIDNNNIVKYSITNWVEKKCGIYINDFTLTCKSDGNNFVYFQNNNFF